jgi:hypothetical protein
MKTILAVPAVLLLAACAVQETVGESQLEKPRAAASALFKALGGELKSAMEKGGPAEAINVCNMKAPVITAKISSEQGMQVARTSLKLRNPNSKPDAWEEQVLREFEQRKAAGEDPAKLEAAKIDQQDGQKTLRYMKAIAIPADAPCLKCHGEKLDPALQTKLKSLYPTDQATGYKTGDIRGAFTIRQKL